MAVENSGDPKIKPIDEFLIRLLNERIFSEKDLAKFQRRFSRERQTPFFTNEKLLKAYHKLARLKKIRKSPALEGLFKTKGTRSLSGIVVVSVLTKPYACPGKCIYCPSQAETPKSYLRDEPAVMRAITCDYDPYSQTRLRLTALKNAGHPTSKVIVRIIGGTWSYYPRRYRQGFVKKIFRACNEFGGGKAGAGNGSLRKSQNINESAKSRVVELSIETRPDFVNEAEIKNLRTLGVTKVELGVQSLYDDILRLNRRGHGIKKTAAATKLLKDAGFKVAYQIMANLPGSDLKRDKLMFKELFEGPDFRPDHLKIYPLALVKEAPAFEFYKKKKFHLYSPKELVELLTYAKSRVPYYCRIERVIRDIPARYIIGGGVKISNLREILAKEMTRRGAACKCIRCREIKAGFEKGLRTFLFEENYEASGGKEIFLSYETEDRRKLFSILRLRIPSPTSAKKKNFLPALQNAALIREVHTYGPQVGVGKRSAAAAQHRGLGKKLISEAEKIAKERGFPKIAVIAGVGVRDYFRKLGYELKDTYMVKRI